MSSTYGDHLKLSIFGQSHGPAIGMVMDGIPAGLPVDLDALQRFLNRRAPGQHNWSTTRKEPDKPEFLGGLVDGFTCGAPIAAIIHNHNIHSEDYKNLSDCPRPGHADYTAHIKYGGFQDYAGGGHFSGRLTAPLCIAGGLCLQWLSLMGIRIRARIVNIGGVSDSSTLDAICPDLSLIPTDFPVIDSGAAERMRRRIDEVHSHGDSIGGIIECCITGLSAGIGEPMFGGVESHIAKMIYGIPAVKSLSFGSGQQCANLLGSQCNDAFFLQDDTILTRTNHSGGILGGITNGMPVIFQCTMKPTPSISLQQESVSLKTGKPAALEIQGRHDPCIVPRSVPVVEAAAAIAIYDLILGNTQTDRRK